MQYKILPFTPLVTDKGGAGQAAAELQKLVDAELLAGWSFKALESMTTVVRPTGCNAFSGKNEIVGIQLAVFEK